MARALSFEDIVKQTKENLKKQRSKTDKIEGLEGNSVSLKNQSWYKAYTSEANKSERNNLKFNNPMSQRDRPNSETIEIDKPLNGTWQNKKGRWNTVSSAIKTLEYNPLSKDVTIQFQNNKKKYVYPDVPASEVVKWSKASSKGRAYNKILKKYSINNK